MKTLTLKELEEAIGIDKELEEENVELKNKIKRKLFTSTQHNKELLKVNEIIGGELGAIASNSSGFYVPDIVRGDIEFELELLGSGRENKFKKKWRNKRFDGKITKKRVLIIAIGDELKKLFDKVYVTEDIESIKLLGSRDN